MTENDCKKCTDVEKKIIEIGGAFLVVGILVIVAICIKKVLNAKYRRDFKKDYDKAEKLFDKCLTEENKKKFDTDEMKESAARKRYILQERLIEQKKIAKS